MAVSCGGCGGIGILVLLLLVFVDASVSPLVDDVATDAICVTMGAMGGGGGGGRGGSIPAVCGIATGICM